LGNDPNFATTITNSLALKANLNSPALITPNLGTPSAGVLTNVTGLPLTGTTGTLPINRGGTGSITQNFVDLTTDQEILGAKTFRNDQPSNVWSRQLIRNATADKTAFIGSIANVAGVFAHNYSLSAWTDLYINGIPDRGGGNVYIPTTTQSTSTTTGVLVVAGGQAVGGNQFVGGKICPTIAPSTDWGIDFATGGSTITLVAGATYDLATGSGMVVIYDNGNGNFNCLFATGGAVVSAAATASSTIVAGSPGAGFVGLFYNGGTAKYRILNNMATTRTLILSTIKMRTAS